jgi:molybdopterin molybdotransferase
LDAALTEIHNRIPALSGVRVSLEDAAGRVLREDVVAAEDSPICDRSTRDGYAILQTEASDVFSVVDTLHAADWKPRQLKAGEAVRVATGAALPCENLRVVMQENVERTGALIKIVRREDAVNVRRRGDEMRAGDTLLSAGKKLDAGALALLASVGCVKPLVSPRLRVRHFTTGDEIVSPEQTPRPGQIRDSNSILIRSLLEKLDCEVAHQHLPEDFQAAKQTISTLNPQLSTCDLTLVSGGASVGDKDFTRPLLEWLGFEIVFDRLKLRPGAPLIFGISGNRAAFGLPGNPLSHFVCFHLFVAAAIKKNMGDALPSFQRGTLAEKLEDKPNPRETLWPARLTWQNGHCELTPLAWSSSGDVAVLAQTNALLRVPADTGSIAVGAAVEFLPVNF